MPKIHVSRKIVIAAPKEAVFELVRNLNHWGGWSPWTIADPSTAVSVDTEGNNYAWEGPVTGAGKMEVVSDKKPDQVGIKLTFLKPFKSLADVRMELRSAGQGTELTWTMDSSLPFFLFFLKGMMEGFIGMDYERGLKMLKDLAETGNVPSKLDFLGLRAYAGAKFVGIKHAGTIPDLASSMEANIRKLHAAMETAKLVPSGKLLCQYQRWVPAKQLVEYTVGFPVAEAPASIPAGCMLAEIPSCQTYVIKHTGPYRHVGNAWSSGYMHAEAKKFKLNKGQPAFEVYETDPIQTAENENVTTVYFPTK